MKNFVIFSIMPFEDFMLFLYHILITSFCLIIEYNREGTITSENY